MLSLIFNRGALFRAGALIRVNTVSRKRKLMKMPFQQTSAFPRRKKRKKTTIKIGERFEEGGKYSRKYPKTKHSSLVEPPLNNRHPL